MRISSSFSSPLKFTSFAFFLSAFSVSPKDADQKMSCAWNKTIHRKVELRLYAIFIPSAQGRHPRGTSGLPLNAAWSPIWHGSQLPIAQDPPLNTEDRTQFVKFPPSSAGSTPAVADFRYRAPLNPRLVWPRFAAHGCIFSYLFVGRLRPLYIITDFFLFFNRFLKN